MAKEEEFDFEDFRIDDDLDFGVDTKPPASRELKGREAVTDLAGHVAKGAVKKVLSPDKRKQIIMNSLPDEFKAGIEPYDKLAMAGRDVFRTAADQLRQTKMEAKRTTRQVLPIVKPFMPKWLEKKLSKFSEDDSYSAPHYDARGAELDAAMSGVFGQAEGGSGDKAETEETVAGQELDKQVEVVRLTKLYNKVNEIANIGRELSAYNNTVGINYRRKMLEYSLRQLFALTDLVEMTKLSNEKLLPAVEGILKNTALPDYAKEEFGEITSAMMKRKLIEAVSPTSWASSFIEQTGENLKSKITEFFGGVRTGMQEIAGATELVSSMSSMSDDEEDLSPSEKRHKAMRSAASMAGGMAAERLFKKPIDKATGWIKEKLGRNETLTEYSKIAQYYGMNIPQLINTMQQDPMFVPEGRLGGSLRKIVDKAGFLLPTYHGENIKLPESEGKSDNPEPWTKRSSHTLNTIIPGLLAKIDQSVRRSYDPNAELEQYDHDAQSFVKTNVIAKRIQDKYNNREVKDYLKKQADKVVDELDPEKKLTPEQRDLLKARVDDAVRNNKIFDIKRLATEFDAWGKDLGKDGVGDVMVHLEELIDKEGYSTSDAHLSTTRRIMKMRNELTERQTMTNELHRLYGSEAMLRSGAFVVNDSGQVTANQDLYDTYKDITTPERAKDAISDTLIAGGKGELKQNPIPANIDIRDLLTKIAQISEDTIRVGVRSALYGDLAPGDVTIGQVIARVVESNKPDEQKKEDLQSIVKAIHDHMVENNTQPQINEIVELVRIITSDKVAGGDAAININMGRLGHWGYKRGTQAVGWLGRKLASVRDKSRILWSKLPEQVRNPVAGIKGAYNTVITTTTEFWKGAHGLRDIYDAAGNIVFNAEWLKNSKYRNKDGTPIKSIKDIRGGVYDEEGNLIFSEEEMREKLKELRYMARDGWHKVVGTLSSWAGQAVNKVFSGGDFVQTHVRNLVKQAKNLVMTSQDIYVKGEEEPRLKRLLMLKGFYVSKLTGKPIRSVGDIDGPVITKHNEEVISESELASPDFQFVDVNGKVLKGRWDTYVDKVKAAGEAALKYAGIGYRWVKGKLVKAKDKLKGGWDWVKGKFSEMDIPELGVGSGSKDIIGRLDKIYTLLDERLAAGHVDKRKQRRQARRAGKSTTESGSMGTYTAAENKRDDTDGDGIRDGSWKDQFKKRTEKVKAAAAAKVAKVTDFAAEKGKEGMGWLKGKMAMLGGLLLSAFAKPKAFIKLGWDLAKSFAGSALSLLGSGLKTLMGGLLRGGWTVLKTAVKSSGALLRGAAWVGRNILWQGLRMAGAAVIGVIGLPATLIAGAIAAGGYLAYRVATSRPTAPIDMLRFAQYGTEDWDNERNDDVAKLRFLEGVMLKFTSYDARGIATIKGMSKEDIGSLAKGMGVNLEDKDDVESWQTWFTSRFLPVYLLWTSRVRQQCPQADFTKIGSTPKVCDPRTQMKIFKGCWLPDNHPIYNIAIGPFDDEDCLTSEDVREVQEEAKEKIQELINDLPEERKAARKSMTDAYVKKNGYSAYVNREPPAPPMPKKITVTDTLTEEANVGPNSGDMLTTVSGTTMQNGRMVGKIITAIDSVRLKTYGLDSLLFSTVEKLYKLEDLAVKSMVKESDGYVFRGDLKKLCTEGHRIFGVPEDKTEAVGRFDAWVENRFLPVFVTFYSTSKRMMPNADPLNLIVSSASPELYDVAVATRDARANVGGQSVGVWLLTTSFWPDGSPINNRPSTLDGNLDYLMRLRREAELREQTADTLKSQKIDPKVPAKKLPTYEERMAANKQYGNATLARILGGQSGSSSPSGSSGGGSTSSTFGDGYTEGPMGGIGPNTSPDFSGGTNGLIEPGTGNYEEIKNAAGNDVIATIVKSGELVGIDPGLLVPFAHMESSLDPKAGAGKSTAKGLFQFINDTWTWMLKRFGNKYGIPGNASPYDPVANSILGAEYVKDGITSLKRFIKRPLTPVDIYMTHLMGTEGGGRFLRNMQKDPNAIAAAAFGEQAASNPGVFGERKTGYMTYAQVYNKLAERAKTAQMIAAKHGVKPGASAMITPSNDAVVNKDAGTAANDAMAANPTAAGTAASNVPAMLSPASAGTKPAAVEAAAATAAPFSGSSALPLHTPDEAKAAETAKAKADTQTYVMRENANDTAPTPAVDKKMVSDMMQPSGRSDTSYVSTAVPPPPPNRDSIGERITQMKREQVKAEADAARNVSASQAVQFDYTSVLSAQLDTQKQLLSVNVEMLGVVKQLAAGRSTAPTPPAQRASPVVKHEAVPISMSRKVS